MSAAIASSVVATLPSPDKSVWHVGPFPIRAYALCILAGIIVAIWLGRRRYAQRGGNPDAILDMSVWAIPFGIVGGRLYHVATTWQPYFGEGGDPKSAFYIWKGGLGIWGAIAFGALGVWIWSRIAKVPLAPVADAVAPGILIAQAIGRLGNWFNNELYGSPTTLPWGLRVHETESGEFVTDTAGKAMLLPGTYHPTFLYELLWNIAAALLLIWLDRKLRLGYGRVFALYVALYCLGRLWIEMLRIDPANYVGGQRLNVWTSILLGLAAVAYFIWSHRAHPGRETVVTTTDPKNTAAVETANDPAAAETDSTATTKPVAKDPDTQGADAPVESADDQESTTPPTKTKETKVSDAPDTAEPLPANDSPDAVSNDTANEETTKESKK